MMKRMLMAVAAVCASLGAFAETRNLAPGDDLVACLASLEGLSVDNPVTVNLAAGTYTAENSGVADDAEWMFTVPSGVILRGAGADVTVLDGGLSRRVLKLLSGAKACDLTVANAYSLGKTDIDRGYAVDVAGGVLAGCVVTNALTAVAGEQVVYVNGGTVSGTRICGSKVTGNTALAHGGVLYVTAGTVTNCQICANNFSDKEHAALTLNGSTAMSVDCDVFGNTANSVSYKAAGSGGVSILSGGGKLIRCRVTGNKNGGVNAYKYTGGLFVAGGDALIDRCVITGNSSDYGNNFVNFASGGVLIHGKATMRNTLVASNRLTGVNYTLAKPKPVGGGVLVTTSASVSIENCTIADNTLDGIGCEGAGIRLTTAAKVVNSIIWKNGGTPAGSTDWMSGNISNTTATVTTCWTDDPSFEAGSYRLSASSPCIDAGTNQDWMDGAVDLADGPRIRNGFVDIGAFESEYMPVYECSIQPTSRTLGSAGGTVPLKAVVTAPASVESAVWTVTAATGDAPAGGEGMEFDLVCPPGVNTYTVSLKVTWSGEHEAVSAPVTVRVVDSIPLAPGGDIVACLASLTGLDASNPVTVNLAAGTYTAENSGVTDDAEWMFTVPSGVILRGAGAGETVLDGELSRRVLKLLSGAKACDLTVANAYSLGKTDIDRGYAVNIADAVLADCVVTNALTAKAGEQVVYLNGGTVSGTRICGSKVSGNKATPHGGILYVTAGTVTNCQICANDVSDKDYTPLTLNGSTAMAVDCDVFGNTANWVSYRTAGSGGVSILSGGGKLIHSRVTGNKSGGVNAYKNTGGLCVAGGNALIDRCVITGNSSDYNNTFLDFTSGGVLIYGAATMRNTLVASNRLTGVNYTLAKPKPVGGGVLVTTSASVSIENCTIADNTLDGIGCEGAGVRLTTAAKVVNSIIWQNGGTPTGGEWMLGNVSNTTASITHTCTTPRIEGAGNIDKDPKLKVKKGYLIRSTSPCVNAGDPTGWTDDDVDLAGNPRLRKDRIDMGCYQAALQGLMLMVK